MLLFERLLVSCSNTVTPGLGCAVSSRAGSPRDQTGRSARGDEARDRGHDHEREGHTDHRAKVRGRHTNSIVVIRRPVEQRRGCAERDASGHELEALHDDHPSHRGRLAAERQADADVARMLLNEYAMTPEMPTTDKASAVRPNIPISTLR